MAFYTCLKECIDVENEISVKCQVNGSPGNFKEQKSSEGIIG
jgi:hypothetical protein